MLPEGVKEAWISYVERRVASAVQFKAGAVVLHDDDLFEITFVSRNTPFKVTCDPVTGGRVEFAYGGGSVGVQIFGFAEDQPPLSVSKMSVAAADLSRVLCERISHSVSQILQP